MRLIDADKAIEDFAHYKKEHCDNTDFEAFLNECPTAIDFSAEEVLKILFNLIKDMDEMKKGYCSTLPNWNDAVSLCAHSVYERIFLIQRFVEQEKQKKGEE